MAKRTPKYCHHMPTGHVRVRIQRKDFYPGPHGSEESLERYDELVSRMFKGTLNTSQITLNVAQLCLAFLDHAKTYYVKNGRITSEVSSLQVALRPGKSASCGFVISIRRARSGSIARRSTRRNTTAGNE